MHPLRKPTPVRKRPWVGWFLVIAATLVGVAPASAQPSQGLVFSELKKDPGTDWNVSPDGHSASKDSSLGHQEIQFPAPTSIPATGATFTWTLIANGGNLATECQAGGSAGLDVKGTPDLHASAYSQGNKLDTKTVTIELKPGNVAPGATAELSVGCFGGLGLRFLYKAGGAAPPASTGTTATPPSTGTTGTPPGSAFPEDLGCKQYAKPDVTLPVAPGTVPFWFEGCAYNVRTLGNLVGDWQLGTATLKGQGVLAADGSVASGGAVVDLDVPQPNTRAVRGKVTMQVLSGTYTDAGDVKTLALKVKITASENVKGLCPVGEEGTLSLIDADTRLRPNGQSSDYIGETWSSGCPHVHGWSNNDNPETEPTNGGRGGGQFADVRISGDASVTRMTLKTDKRVLKAGDSAWIPVTMLLGTNVANLNFEVSYDPRVVQVLGGEVKGSFFATALGQVNTGQSGRVLVGFARPDGESGSGTVAYIQYKAVGRPGDVTPLTLKVSSINNPGGQVPPIDVIHGEIRIVDENGLTPGSCDGSLTLTESDAMCALKMSVELFPTQPVMDMDKDGRVTSRDATLILQKIFPSGA